MEVRYVDAVLPVPIGGFPLDRRRLVALVLGGVGLFDSGVSLMDDGGGPKPALATVRHTVAVLAAEYETADPRKTAAELNGVERAMATVFAERMHPARLLDAKAAYAQVLTMSANVAADLGGFRDAVRTGELAASLAFEAGDPQTAGQAWSIVAGALLNAGSARAAVSAAQRARAHAGDAPAGVRALIEEATATAAMGRVHKVIDVIAAAEAEHARLPAQAWGTPGFSLKTFHLADLLAFAGWSLNRVGMFAEAAPRLAEAAELLAGSPADGLRSFVWLSQASAALGTGNVDGAYELTDRAVAQAETRPAAWVAGTVTSMNNRSGGALADLAERAERWGF
jgi:hypothetical protein